jgi:hypothetical protein
MSVRYAVSSRESVLTVVYNTQSDWASELCPSSVILNTRKHNVWETGSVSVLKCGEGDT